MRYLILLSLLFSGAIALKVDVDYLKREIVNDPQDIKYRLILVRHFISEGNMVEAKKYLKDSLSIDPNNKDAIRYKIRLNKILDFKDYLLSHDIADFTQEKKILTMFNTLFNQKKYQEYIKVYKNSNSTNMLLSEKIHFQAIKSYLSIGDTTYVRSILDMNLIKNYSDTLWSEAQICILQKDYSCARNYYHKLLSQSLDEKYFVELFDLEQKRVDSKELELLYREVNLLFPSRSISTKIAKKLEAYDDERLDFLKSDYYSNRSLDLLRPYAYKLHARGEANKAIDEIEKFIENAPDDNRAKYLLAKIYSWSGYSQKSISLLEPLMKSSDDYEILSFFVDNLYQAGEYKKSTFYLNRMLKLTTNKDEILKINNRLATINKFKLQKNREQSNIKIQTILAKAVEHHKRKSYKLAITYYEKYYNYTKDKKITKEIAELSFLEGDLKKADKFYKIYLFAYPSDLFMNFRYASLLEKQKEYQQSIPILKRVVHGRDENYYLAKYHLAFNLMLLDNDLSWLESREIFHDLEDELIEDESYQGRTNMLSLITQVLERVDQDRPKASSHKDIMLGAGQKKLIDADILYPVNIKVVDSLSTFSILDVEKKLKNDKPRESVSIDYRSINDDTIFSTNYGIRGTNLISVDGKHFGASLSKFQIRTDNKKHESTKVALNMRTKNMNVSIGFNEFADFTEVVPKIEYSQKVANHNMNVGLSYQNGVFSNYRQQMTESNIKNLQLTFYDAILMRNLEYSEVWAQANIYDNNAQGYSLGFNYPLWKMIATDNAQLPILINGNYEYNTNPEASYSPSEFYDSNFIDMRPKLSLGRGTYLSGLGGMGYSIESKDMLFHYGLSSSVLLFDVFEFLLNCKHMQSQYSKYGSDECSASLGYIW